MKKLLKWCKEVLLLRYVVTLIIYFDCLSASVFKNEDI